MRLSPRLIAALVGVAMVCAAVAVAQTAGTAEAPATAAPEPPPARVDVAEAVAADFAPMQWTPGSVASREDARVAAETGGRIVEVAAVGAAVRRGDLLARIDDTASRLREREAQAALDRLQVQLEFLRRQESRFSALGSGGAISGAQLDQATAERRTREQDVAAAKVALEQARLQVRQSMVRAPFDGVVVERATEAGQFVGAGEAVARLVNTGALEIRTRAPVALAADLHEGTMVTLRDGARRFELPLSTQVPVGDAASRQLELRIALTPAQAKAGGWVVGAAVQVGVPSGAARGVVAVPRDALVMRADGTYVVRIGAGDLGERVPVEVGVAQGDLVAVEGAVRAGDRLVVRGGERLQPGQRVSVVAPAGAVAANPVARTQP